MAFQVVRTRIRTVEEKVIATVSSADPRDALAASEHLLEGRVINWKYNRTVEVSQPVVEVRKITE